MGGKKREGLLILSGGNDAEEGPVTDRIAEETLARGGKLVICTAPSASPVESGREYADRFRDRGLKKVEVLDLRIREQALDPGITELLDDAACVFFTGGDQLRLTATIADTPVFNRIRELFEEEGAVIAGTSAGSAAMPQTMMISGETEVAPEATQIGMAPGLGFVDGIVLDTHFAERGRIGRLVAAVAQNPRNLGLGLDEDTAVVIEPQGFGVIGSGSVYVVDGQKVRYSSLSGRSHRGITSVYGLALHVLADGDHFDMSTRMPIIDPEERRGERDEARDTRRRVSSE